jgi:hypothetical protein
MWGSPKSDARSPEVAYAEKVFVEYLLFALANGNTVRNATWGKAQDLWECTVKDQTDLGKTNPEVSAMFVLTAIATAGADVEVILRQVYIPGP